MVEERGVSVPVGAARRKAFSRGRGMKMVILGNQAGALVNFWTVLLRRALEGGHEVVCAVPDGDGRANAALARLGARLVHYRLDRKGVNPLRDLRTLRDLTRLLKGERPDLLFASTIKPVIYGCMAARFAGVPRVYAAITGLGYAFEADSVFKRCVRLLGVTLYRMALRGAEGIFFQNRDDAQVFRERGIIGGGARVLFTRGVGVDTRRFAAAPPPPLPPVFLFVGRLLEAKGLPEYAAAARMLKARYPAARFQVLGPPEQGFGSVGLDRVRAWEAGGCIEYLGRTDDVRPFLAAAHVLVLPSWREGTPTSIMEGMSMGRPAVVTDVPGCREVVRDGVNGSLVPVRDVRALARAMENFILMPESIARMGAAARETAVRECDAEHVAGQMLGEMNIPRGVAP
ncbi:MAG: glycosyltransferase family 4 protein [Desulfovibrio sp.]|jgi:glycosyltransferase involved in cell wall biosynthesis|nr:glycosyltransferase family 4 protein [Desulfovibrio sp.]